MGGWHTISSPFPRVVVPQAMVTHVLNWKPADPVAFLISFLQHLEAANDMDADFQACFEALDTACTGSLSMQQVCQVRALGASRWPLCHTAFCCCSSVGCFPCLGWRAAEGEEARRAVFLLLLV